MSDTNRSSGDLAVLALGALEDDDRGSLDRSLASDPDFRRELAGYEDTVKGLVSGYEPVDPGDDVWKGIEARISLPAQMGSGRRRRYRATILASIAAVAALVLGVVALIDRADGDGFAALAAEIAADPQSETLALVDPATGESLAEVVVAEDGTAFFVDEALAALPDDRTYQLWAVVGDEIVSAGLLGAEPETVALRLEADPSVLALTVEKAGGVAVSNEDPVALWAVPAA